MYSSKSFSLQGKGLSIDLLQTLVLKAMKANIHLLPHHLQSGSKTHNDRPILTTMFHPEDSCLGKIINRNWGLLGKGHSTLSEFNQRPLVAYRRLPNLTNLLVRDNCQLKRDKATRVGTKYRETKTFLINAYPPGQGSVPKVTKV